MLKQIQEGQLDSATLSDDKRRVCVKYLMFEQASVARMAEMLKVSVATIKRDRKKIREDNGIEGLVIDEQDLVHDLIETAENAVQKLTAQGKHRDAWAVKKELIEMLQTLGYINKEPISIEGNLNFLEVLALAHAKSTQPTVVQLKETDPEAAPRG